MIARPVRAHHDALDVVAGSVAADERPGEFDGVAVLIEGDAFDHERGVRGGWSSSRLARSQQHGFERFAGARDVRAVLLGQDVVQRVVLEVGGQEAGKPLGRQVDLLEQERFPEATRRRSTYTIGEPTSRFSAPATTSPADSGRAATSRLGVEAAALHLLGEAEGVGEVALDARLEGERAAPRVRSRRPSRASSLSARRIVMRLQL